VKERRRGERERYIYTERGLEREGERDKEREKERKRER
jgi:hypothetical protein